MKAQKFTLAILGAAALTISQAAFALASEASDLTTLSAISQPMSEQEQRTYAGRLPWDVEHRVETAIDIAAHQYVRVTLEVQNDANIAHYAYPAKALTAVLGSVGYFCGGTNNAATCASAMALTFVTHLVSVAGEQSALRLSAAQGLSARQTIGVVAATEVAVRSAQAALWTYGIKKMVTDAQHGVTDSPAYIPNRSANETFRAAQNAALHPGRR